ncbi:hypothetical protein OK016_08550 [Vibrio chagasii]|nr:hypothetical protein [Vibrio chagasii]
MAINTMIDKFSRFVQKRNGRRRWSKRYHKFPLTMQTCRHQICAGVCINVYIRSNGAQHQAFTSDFIQPFSSWPVTLR